MFDQIFENRDKKIADLIRLGDCLGRSLRENVCLLSVDDANSRVSYLTEGEKVVTGDYTLDDGVELDFIIVEDFDAYTDENKFDSFVNQKVSRFVESLYADDFSSADTTFADILDTWTSRLKFDQVKQRLHEKNTKFNDSQNILGTSEFHNFINISDQIARFLDENFESIANVPEIVNGVRLSDTVTKAFDLPRLNYDTLGNIGTYRVSNTQNKTIYEMICRQELVKKELLESKQHFNEAWACSNAVKNLAGMVFEKNDDRIFDQLSEVLDEVPYFAFVNKKDLFDTVKNTLSISESFEIKDEHIKTFINKLFEMKKPVRTELISILNEKYGINVQNLKEVPSFKSLINTQVVVLETLARVFPKNSVEKQVLREFATSLRSKTGVQSLDVNDCLKVIFESAGFGEVFESGELINDWEEEEEADVETSLDPSSEIERDEELPTIDEEETPGDEDEEPQEPDHMEDKPEEEKEEDEESVKDESDTEDPELSKEEFMDAMKELESILGDISPDTENPDDENR